MDLAEFLGGHIVVKVGDITLEDADAIVNAANSTLLGGGGVDGAIHARGGPKILAECRVMRETVYPKGLPTGEAVITTAGNLPARHVIHTVGPVYGLNEGRDAELLGSCYRKSVELALSYKLRSIAFPSVSTGAYGYPKHEAAPVVWNTLTKTLERHNQVEVRLVFFSETDAKTFIKHR
jgi:O-acetyl-ADP-ribose deacetylase (regulator of RNase III)